jgi:antitoxin HicB
MDGAPMPRKIRELRRDLAGEGFKLLPKRGKGSHTLWEHPSGVVAIMARAMMATTPSHISKSMSAARLRRLTGRHPSRQCLTHLGGIAMSESNEHQEPTSSVRSHYSLVIQWSDEDQLYVVSFPEWEATGRYFLSAHGQTYAEAAQSGQEVLDEILAHADERGWPLPAPRTYTGAPSERASA